MLINAPSLANIPITEFTPQLQELHDGGVRFFHVDLMDGHYVPNLCFPVRAVGDIKRSYPDCEVEVHMMVSDPFSYIRRMKEEGADRVSFHIDSTSFVRRCLTEIRAFGMKAGVALNPSQNIEVLRPFMHYLDQVVFMSVEPGFAGQKFLEGSLERLAELVQFREKNGLDFMIIVDGGVHYGILEDVVKTGADAVVTNIYTIFNQPEGIVGACKKFDEAVKSYECKG